MRSSQLQTSIYSGFKCKISISIESIILSFWSGWLSISRTVANWYVAKCHFWPIEWLLFRGLLIDWWTLLFHLSTASSGYNDQSETCREVLQFHCTFSWGWRGEKIFFYSVFANLNVRFHRPVKRRIITMIQQELFTSITFWVEEGRANLEIPTALLWGRFEHRVRCTWHIPRSLGINQSLHSTVLHPLKREEEIDALKILMLFLNFQWN